MTDTTLARWGPTWTYFLEGRTDAPRWNKEATHTPKKSSQQTDATLYLVKKTPQDVPAAKVCKNDDAVLRRSPYWTITPLY